MKFRTILFLIFSCFLTLLNAQTLKGFLYTANFNTPDNKSYVECYFSFDQWTIGTDRSRGSNWALWIRGSFYDLGTDSAMSCTAIQYLNPSPHLTGKVRIDLGTRPQTCDFFTLSIGPRIWGCIQPTRGRPFAWAEADEIELGSSRTCDER